MALGPCKTLLYRVDLRCWNLHNTLHSNLTYLTIAHTLGGIWKGTTVKLLKTLAAGIIALVAVLNPQDYAAIIDVRTPEEWNSGHLAGAVRMGIADSDFASQLETLDKSADYYIYCRSGNRAGQAIDFMESIGFTGELVNGGSVANASTQLGLEVVTD
ncbi:MAG: rhodanese-like domain-containing protein [Actinobacteria bacterium]|nr:rhodanese-like domain-containing protein [Actinomycetota bacterium]